MSVKHRVGYKNPPLHTRFRKGRSGNPRGRPKGARNLKVDLLEEFSEMLIVHEGTRELRVSKQRALIKSLTAQAIKGNTAAAGKLVDLYTRLFGLQDQDLVEPAQPLSTEEQEVLTALESRLVKLSGITPPRRGTRETEDA